MTDLLEQLAKWEPERFKYRDGKVSVGGMYVHADLPKEPTPINKAYWQAQWLWAIIEAIEARGWYTQLYSGETADVRWSCEVVDPNTFVRGDHPHYRLRGYHGSDNLVEALGYAFIRACEAEVA